MHLHRVLYSPLYKYRQLSLTCLDQAECGHWLDWLDSDNTAQVQVQERERGISSVSSL